LAAILLITSISAANDYIKEKQFIDLLEVAKDYDVSCIRGQHGTTAPINAWELVVGDLITFEAGDRIPADCLLLDSIDLRVDEAYHHDDVETIVDKHQSDAENLLENHDSFLMAESLVVEGSGKALILVVYEPFCSRHRRVLKQDDDNAEVSPLKERLANIGSQIGKLGIYAALILFAILVVRNIINLLAQKENKFMSAETLKKVLNILTTCITLVMVAVPEGLPLSVSISVAFSLSKMKKANLLIKNADSQEIMGGVEYIITGKTGTLTKADMRVTHFYINGKFYENKGAADFSECQEISAMRPMLEDSIIYNCTAKVEMSENAYYVPSGNGTECCMLKFLQNNGHAIQDEVKAKVGRVRAFVPWTPIRKMESTAIEYEDEGVVRVFSKGAPEVLLLKCAIDSSEQQELLQVTNNKLGANGIRPFAYAFKEYRTEDFNELAEMNDNFSRIESRSVLEEKLTFQALFGLRDELRSSFRSTDQTV
jgi:Ca2+-transporting ATPase